MYIFTNIFLQGKHRVENVLVKNVALLGEFTQVENFHFDVGAGSDWSCSAVINGQMTIFGGNEQKLYSTQISVVESCQLRRLGTLPMTPFFRTDSLLYQKFENMVLFRWGNVYSLCSPENQDYQKDQNRQCKSCIYRN